MSRSKKKKITKSVDTKYIRKIMTKNDGKNLPKWLLEDLLDDSILYRKDDKMFRIRPIIKIGINHQAFL